MQELLVIWMLVINAVSGYCECAISRLKMRRVSFLVKIPAIAAQIDSVEEMRFL